MIDLGDGYSLDIIDAAELSRIQNEHFKNVFVGRSNSPLKWKIPEAAQAKINSRQKEIWALRLGVYFEGSAVGWHHGFATDVETYYMQNSAIIKEHRGNSLYSRMLKEIIPILEREGFQVITSLHHPNNFNVLIPKLKNGFVISAMQVHERFRFLVELKYFFDPERRKSFDMQIGFE